MLLRKSFVLMLVALGALLARPGSLSAQVMQTSDGTPLPQPVAQAEIQLSMDLGWKADLLVHRDMAGMNLNPPVTYQSLFPNFVNGDAVTLAGLFKWRRENIDPVRNALTAPGYFSPACGFSGELVLRGGNCNLAFGWYNVADPNNPTPPAANEIYELIPSNTETYMQCVTQNGAVQPEGTGFCPFGWDNHHPYNPPQVAWTPTAFDSGMIASDPRYRGGFVAFALIGNPMKQCRQTKHSIAAHNTKSTAGPPWITTLIWQSTVDPEAFYIGFEDLAMTPESWRNPGPGAIGQNDGDFNDFVYYISGISCQGGGQACDTGLQGACSIGRTDCAVEGMTGSCRPVVQPGREICDNVDNDCNGVPDDGMGLCPANFVCDKGSCVQACNTGEFMCTVGLQCRNGFCIDTACADVTCEPGQACRQGTCVNACDGVTCPLGQECQLGRCVDPCAGVMCPTGRVCERGLCVSNCSCRACAQGLTCAGDGRCVDTACDGVTCPAGQRCVLGACKDPCEGVVCPGGGTCINGACTDPVPGGGISGSGGGISIGAGSPGSGLGNPGSGGNGNGAGPDGGGGRATADSGCGCRTASTGRSPLALLGGSLAVGLWLLRRRRR